MCATPYKKLTSAAAATALGVSESSVKRWVDLGELEASVTPGGHRRIDIFVLGKFAASRGISLKKLGTIDPDDVFNPEDTASIEESFRKALAVGDISDMTATIQQCLLSGLKMPWICDHVITPAYAALRQTCQHPSEECVVLHRALESCRRALLLKQEATVERPDIIFADIGYEVDSLPTFLAESCAPPGVNILQLGFGVPSTVLAGVLKKLRPRILYLSGHGPGSKKKLRETAEKIAATSAKNQDIQVLWHSDAGEIDGGVTIHSFEEMAGFVRGALQR